MVMPVFSLKSIPKLVFFLAISVFFASLFSEIFFDKVPCQLCLVTRYLFLSIAVFSLISARLRKFRHILIVATSLTLSFSFFHLGVENHWWLGPQSCVSELPTLDSLNNLDPIHDVSKAYCDKVNWRILGISSTLWSFLISAFVFWIVSLSYILNYYLKKARDDD